jgi:hypothetical protein
MVRKLVKAAFLAWIAKKIASRALRSAPRPHRRHARTAARASVR